MIFKSEQITLKNGELVVVCVNCEEAFPLSEIGTSKFISEESAKEFAIKTPSCKECYTNIVDELKEEHKAEQNDLLFLSDESNFNLN